MNSERKLGPRTRTVEGLSGTLGIDASGARKLAAREIDFVFSPPRRDKQTQERIFDELAELRMAGGE